VAQTAVASEDESRDEERDTEDETHEDEGSKLTSQ
jgi:hypothetical protein